MTIRDVLKILEAIANAQKVLQQIFDAVQNKTKIDITNTLPPMIDQLGAVHDDLSETHIAFMHPEDIAPEQAPTA